MSRTGSPPLRMSCWSFWPAEVNWRVVKAAYRQLCLPGLQCVVAEPDQVGLRDFVLRTGSEDAMQVAQVLLPLFVQLQAH